MRAGRVSLPTPPAAKNTQHLPGVVDPDLKSGSESKLIKERRWATGHGSRMHGEASVAGYALIMLPLLPQKLPTLVLLKT